MCVECERGVWQHGGRMFKVHAAPAILQYWPHLLWLLVHSWCLLQAIAACCFGQPITKSKTQADSYAIAYVRNGMHAY